MCLHSYYLTQSKGNVAKVLVKVLLDCNDRVLLFNLLNMFFVSCANYVKRGWLYTTKRPSYI